MKEKSMDKTTSSFQKEIESGERFKFGENWKRFLETLNEERIVEAEKSLKSMLGLVDLNGMTFLDIGCGSGIFSLAAKRLGATVHSFDFDPTSVACAMELRRRFFGEESGWQIESGSALDERFLGNLGMFDIVYSWGVLHHTGAMWQAIANATNHVKENGLLFISIYNDQGLISDLWKKIKRTYVRSPESIRRIILTLSSVVLWGPTFVKDAIRLSFGSTWINYKKNRGMSPWHDIVDWVGGYPFDVSKPNDIVDYLKSRGFLPVRIKTCGKGLGCNEFVFKKGNFLQG